MTVIKEVMATLKEGEEKPHCRQQHWVSLPKKKTTMNMGWML
jgi:hypothetical protein